MLSLNFHNKPSHSEAYDQYRPKWQYSVRMEAKLQILVEAMNNLKEVIRESQIVNNPVPLTLPHIQNIREIFP